MSIVGKRVVITSGHREGQRGVVHAICDDSRPSWYVETDGGEWTVLSGMQFAFEVA